MNYNFRYKSKFEKKCFNQKLNKIFSYLLFFLYNNRLLKKLKLDRNKYLKGHIHFEENRQNPKLKKSKIPENPNLNVYNITFLDCIDLEDSQKLKNRLIKLISRYKGDFMSGDPHEELNTKFEKFDSEYETISYGHLFHNDTKANKELDLIDGITYGYVKAAQSHFVITYTINPSDKFKRLFKQSIDQETTLESEINFKSIKQIIKTKRLFSSIGLKFKTPEYWVEKLFNEITFQFKTEVVSNLKIGIFNLSDKVLFPRITSFEYDPIEFKDYEGEIFNRLHISKHNMYTGSDIIFSLKNVDYSKKSSNGLEMFIPYKTNDEKEKDPFNAISYLSSTYMQAIASYWTLINLSCLREQDIVELRNKTFKYIRRNKISLFLRKVIRLKNNLTLNWISFERIRKDFSNDIFKHLLYAHEIPDTFNSPRLQGTQPDEFKKSLIHLTETKSNNIKNSYEEILELHSHIGKDNLLRASMKLQRFLFIIALIGIILTLYGSNSDWCNSWIEYCLNKVDIKIPRV